MREIFKRILAVLTLLTLLAMPASLVFTAQDVRASSEKKEESASYKYPAGPEIISETAVLMDADTGAILYNKDMDRVLYPASTAKVMTCLLALENGNLSDQVTMTETGVYYAQSGSSNLLTQVGEVFTLEQLLYGTMLKSANDMATQVGEYIGGTVEHFVDMMNERAAEIGCTNTHFTNACGMPDPDMVITAHDLALIGREALKNETFRKITGTHAYTIPPTNMNGAREITSHNPLLVNPDWAYPGIIGGKTGYTDSALNTMVTFVGLNGRTLIAATLMASDATYSAQDHRNLYDYGFAAFENVEVIPDSLTEEGGMATVLKGAPARDVAETESETADGQVRIDFSLDGHDAGYAILTKENAETLRTDREAAAKEEEERLAAEQAEKDRIAAQKEAARKAEEEKEAQKEREEKEKEERDKDTYLETIKHFLENWRSYLTPLNIALAALGLLIIVLVIVMIKAASRRRRRRKKKKKKKRKKKADRP